MNLSSLAPREAIGAAAQPYERVFGISSIACQGAAVVDVLGAESGENRFHHQAFCLQRWFSPLTVRPLKTPGSWLTLSPQSRLWLHGEPMYFEWSGSVRQHFVFVTPERVEQILEQPYARSGIESWGGRDFDDPFVNQLVTTMVHDCVDGSPAGPLVVDALVTAFVTRLAGTAPTPSRVAPARVRRVLDFIEAELHRPLSLAELVTQAGVGVRQFSAAFRCAMRTSAHQYLLQRRTERAKQLLHEGQLGLADIAAAVGFSDQSQFSKNFSRIVGVSPGQYRLHLQ